MNRSGTCGFIHMPGKHNRDPSQSITEYEWLAFIDPLTSPRRQLGPEGSCCLGRIGDRAQAPDVDQVYRERVQYLAASGKLPLCRLHHPYPMIRCFKIRELPSYKTSNTSPFHRPPFSFLLSITSIPLLPTRHSPSFSQNDQEPARRTT